jgi:hypothetical protein
VIATSATDFIVSTGYAVWLLRAGLAAMFRAERFEGNR